MLHAETVSPETLDLIKRVMADKELNAFYLVGGTALALKTGHRISIDIDMFTGDDFDANQLSEYLKLNYETEILHTENNTCIGYIENIKADFIAHKYPLINNIEATQGMRILSLLDIGAMKLNAIVQNGSRLKDFVDVYFLLEQYSLHEIMNAHQRKYANANRDIVFKALLFHGDIDFKTEVILKETNRVQWNKIAKRLNEAVIKPESIFSKKDI